jgi:hypothetical protein
MTLQIAALDRAKFQPLLAMSAAELWDRMAVRLTADKKPEFHCRVSLADAEVRDEVLLVPQGFGAYQAERLTDPTDPDQTASSR